MILASASPRRKELLELLNVNFRVIPSGVQEVFTAHETPLEHALKFSRQKALSISIRHPDSWTLGADTIVVIDGEPLGKPENPAQARRMLQKLSGRTHRVITGFAVARGSEVIANQAVESEVLFKEIAGDEMEWYIGTSEPYDKAGGYAIQGAGAFLIKEIHGSFTNVIGLPLTQVADVLKKLGILRFDGFVKS